MSTPKAERTRKTILSSARRLIEADPHRWTMEDVAENARVTRMTVYRYFPSRTDLLIETVRHVDQVEGAESRFAKVPESASGVEALETWTRIWIEYVPHIAPMAKALLSARSHDQAAARAWADRMAALRHGPINICKWLKSDGTLADHLSIETGADLMWAIASVQTWDALTNDRHWSAQKVHQQLSLTLKRALTSTDG
jgi:AcrR family transcriptional regulator